AVDVELDIAEDIQHFGDADLPLGLTRILADSRHDLVGVTLDGSLEPGELGLALFGGGSLDVPLVVPLQLENSLQLGGDVGGGLRGAGHEYPVFRKFISSVVNRVFGCKKQGSGARCVGPTSGLDVSDGPQTKFVRDGIGREMDCAAHGRSARYIVERDAARLALGRAR